jgi:hypothetical protein
LESATIESIAWRIPATVTTGVGAITGRAPPQAIANADDASAKQR